MGDVSRETSPALPARFAETTALLGRYADLLATDGVTRGLIGPREVDRLWDRHILNSAVVADLIPEGHSVVDVGSGAGLPGLPLAIVRPDLQVTLLEPLLRRSDFLREAVQVLELADRVRVVRGRAEDHDGRYATCVARAVAPLSRLAPWCLPLVRPGGQLLAMKGGAAQAEVNDAASVLTGMDVDILTCGESDLDVPTTVVRVVVPTGGAQMKVPR